MSNNQKPIERSDYWAIKKALLKVQLNMLNLKMKKAIKEILKVL